MTAVAEPTQVVLVGLSGAGKSTVGQILAQLLGWRFIDLDQLIADKTALTLYLFPHLPWHDGVPTTARDVAFTLEAARDPRAGFPRVAELRGITAIEARDDTTVIISFRDPPPTFPLILSDLPVVPAHLLADVPRDRFRQHAFATAPTGTARCPRRTSAE